MKRISLLSILLGSFHVAAPAVRAGEVIEAEVCIYGGTAGGVATT